MITTTALFQAAVRSSHQIASRAILLSAPGSTGLDPAGVRLPIIGGSVTLDNTADIRGALDLTINADWPAGFDATKYVTPYGSEIAVSRGVTYGNGNIERVQLGIFRVDTVEEQTRGQLHVTAYDRSKQISEAQFLQPVQYPAAAWTNGTAVNDLVTGVFPGATVTWDNTTVRDQALPRDMAENQDRLGLINAIVTQLGMFFYATNQGQFAVKTTPAYNGLTPVWSANARMGKGPGQLNAVLASTDRRASRQDFANAVVVTGESLDGTAPIVSFAYDGNPASATYFLGDCGQVPYFASTVLTSQSACDALAVTLLSQMVGLPMSVDFEALCNPSLEPNDAVSITFASPTLGSPVKTMYPETHVLTAVSIPLAAGDIMQARTRLQSAAKILNGNPL